ncbi:hypothetical protein EUBSIR_00395 [[Eubacterium] siraeum DSM 15702]|uniref:Uncharacterized protein n=1 Tax=[Eubacterium] siraeum DSM 15702 TaxID=428128 RepID=B0MKS7_9FIRM|nr:hypothetical protein EUBSIR_00395 [[Eubacterium] siraeum DSM 15702]
MNGRKRLCEAVFGALYKFGIVLPSRREGLAIRLIPPWEKILFYMRAYETPGTVCFIDTANRIFPPKIL